MMKTLFGAALLAGVAVAAQEDLGKIVSGAEKLKKTTRKITADQAKAIAAAVGLKPEEVETNVTILEGWALVPDSQSMDKARIFGVVVTVKGPKGPIKLGVAVAADEDTVVNVKVLENKDDKSAEAPEFIDQFPGFKWGASIRKSSDDLKGALAKAKENKEAAALVEISASMRKLGVQWAAMVKKNDKADKGAKAHAEEVARLYEALGKKIGDLAFLSDRQRKTLTDDMAKAARSTRDISGRLDGSDAAKKAIAEMDNLCTKCHAPMRTRFIDQREKDGVGNGWLSPEVDLTIPLEGSKELYDAMAKAIRKAILQIRDAK